MGAGYDRRAQARGRRVTRYYQRLRCESLGISWSLDKSHDMTHFSDGVGGCCAHCVLFSCIISTADADGIRAESKYFLFFCMDTRICFARVNRLDSAVVPDRLSVVSLALAYSFRGVKDEEFHIFVPVNNSKCF